jgi:putative hydrolase of the HAD superfamily
MKKNGFLMDSALFHQCTAILFDFGGTLDSDGEHWLDRFYDLYEKTGLNIRRTDIKRIFYATDARCCEDPAVNTMGLRQLMTRHIRLQFEQLGLADTAAMMTMIESFCSRTVYYLHRNAGILSRLKHRFRLGVVSNFYGNVETLCREAGLSESLEVILDSMRVGVGKPDPSIFRLALNKLDLSPENVIFVGDSYERDMIPARKIGFKTVWLKGPNPRKPADAEPVDTAIESLSELERRLS